MTAPPSRPGPPADLASRYAARAESVARGVAQEWLEGEPDDLRVLADAAYAQLVEEANLELRQALTQAQGQLELALRAMPADAPGFPRARTDAVQDALSRATTILDTWLDRGMATKALVHIEPQRFDLAAACRARLRAGVRVAGDACLPLEGDEARLLQALDVLARRLRAHGGATTPIALRLARDREGRVAGFLGAPAQAVSHDALLAELVSPAPLKGLRVDMLYARAILERHGGELGISAEGGERGFSFRLPAPRR